MIKKKRILAGALAFSLMAPITAGAVTVQIPSADGTQNVTVDTANDPVKETIVTGLTPQQLSEWLALQDPEQAVSGTLDIAEIKPIVKQNNRTILANDQIIPGKQAVIDEAIEDLEDGISDMKKGIRSMKNAADGYDDAISSYQKIAASSGQMGAQLSDAVLAALCGNDAALAGGMVMLLQSSKATLESQISQMEDQLDQLEDQLDELEDTDFTPAERQLEYVSDQLAMGAETLYIGLQTMQSQYDSMVRKYGILTLKLNEMNVRYKLGQVSSIDVAGVRDGIRTMESGMKTMQTTIRNYKGDLNLMLGRDAGINFTLTALPTVDEAQIRNMNLANDLARAKGNSYTIYAAEEALKTAKDGDGADRKYNIIKAEIELENAEKTFEQDFTKLFRNVQDKLQALEAQRGARGYAISLLNADETRYKLGKISLNTITESRTDAEEAGAALKSAENALYQAYLAYEWGLHGVIASSGGMGA